jgi:3-phenylpropionate/trans-cinnamate dioxygenase ferredoxin subunit
MAEYVFAAKLNEVKEGAITALVIGDVPVALTLLNGQVRAFGDICTHDDGPLAEGHIAGNCVVCPRHGATFDLLSGKPTFPAVTRIPIYEAVVEGDDVKIKL